MSAREKRRIAYNDRASSRLDFLVDCMSDTELCRLELMTVDEERPHRLMILRRIDEKRKRFERADRRLRRGEKSEPQKCRCMRCRAEWIAFYLPQSASDLAKIMDKLRCPKCGEGSSNIKPIDAPRIVGDRAFLLLADELANGDPPVTITIKP